MTNDRVEMARRLRHAPDACSRCGGDYEVRRFSGGGGLEDGYRESGRVRCVSCGNEESWSVRRDPAPARSSDAESSPVRSRLLPPSE